MHIVLRALPALIALVLATPALATDGDRHDPATAPKCAPPGPPPQGKGPPPGGATGSAHDGADAPPPPPDGQHKGPPPHDGKGAPPCPPPKGGKPGGDGQPPGPPPGGGQYTLAAAYTVSSTASAAESGRHYASAKADESAVWVKAGGNLTLERAELDKRGDSSSHENSSFYGLNAALLVTAGGQARLRGGSILANGLGANALSVVDKGSSAELDNVKLIAHGQGAHGVDAANGGRVVLRQVDIETFDQSAAAVATDRGGGQIHVTGGTLLAHGYRSPGLYSTGTIQVEGSHVRATGAEAAVIEGSNTIEVRNAHLQAGKSWGAMLYQSFSGDAQGQQSRYLQHGGSFAAAEGPLFYVTNTTGEIELEAVALQVASGVLVKASDGQWGSSGHNGGHARLHAVRQALPGDLVAEHGGSVQATLAQGSVLTGRVLGGALSIDADSRWEVTGDSSLVSLEVAGADIQARLGRLQGHGHTVRYDAKTSANAWLGGKRWALPGGGWLQPAG